MSQPIDPSLADEDAQGAIEWLRDAFGFQREVDSACGRMRKREAVRPALSALVP